MKLYQILLGLLLHTNVVQAVYSGGKLPYVTYDASSSDFSLLDCGAGKSVDVITDKSDWPGVVRAANDLVADFGRVAKCETGLPKISVANGGAFNTTMSKDTAIIIGTAGKSKIIDELVAAKKIDTKDLKGKWESWTVQIVKDVKVSGATFKSALVIVGSDKRGSIFGTYDLSEQVGVSPWYYWADVTPTKRSSIGVKLAGTYKQGEPSVKYRGIFLNDEQPGLTEWVYEHYKTNIFGHEFYVTVFELLLRLKANYLWPVMWDSAFNRDDPENQRLADEYGIVMSTSHHEPMMRAQKEFSVGGQGQWNYTTNSDWLKEFWDGGIKRAAPYESYITLGMRGDGDLPYSEDLAIHIQEQIVNDQREILSKYDLGKSGQVWCLYKEVQGYYEIGMKVPDDVTLLWADDNWGNIRRLPTPSEASREGGAGVYYHFDYVGDPRSYKWINTNDIAKVQEQLQLAIEREANRLFIVNVGDLKPMELPIDFFMSYAWDATQWTKDNLAEYHEAWAMREFGESVDAKEIGALASKYAWLNARRKPESVDVNTWSIINYNEAEDYMKIWEDLEARALAVEGTIPTEKSAAYYELVLYPIQASATVAKIYIHAALNNLHSTQVRNSANYHMDKAEELFVKDMELTKKYHTLLDNKWNHMLDQPHLNFQYWQQVLRNTLPAMSKVQIGEPSIAGAFGLSIEGLKGAWPGDNQFQCARGYGCPPATLKTMTRYGKPRWVDVFTRSNLESIDWSSTTSDSWIKLSKSSGVLTLADTETRVWVSIDWDAVPAGTKSGKIEFTSPVPGGSHGKKPVEVIVPIEMQAAVPSNFKGHVEGDGYVSIEAVHYSSKKSVDNISWELLGAYGQTLGAVTTFPRASKKFLSGGNAPTISYDFYLYNTPPNGKLNVTCMIGPAMNTDPESPILYDISIDGGDKVRVQPVDNAAPGSQPAMWKPMVRDNIVRKSTAHSVTSAGKHTVTITMVTPNFVLEKLVLDVSGTTPLSITDTYIGPPESKCFGQCNKPVPTTSPPMTTTTSPTTSPPMTTTTSTPTSTPSVTPTPTKTGKPDQNQGPKQTKKPNQKQW